jgi:putative transposase
MVYNNWGLYGLMQMPGYKCLRFGKELSIMRKRDTTKTCHVCNASKTCLCENCGLVMNRDDNSAVNIYQRFLAWPGPHTP